MKPRPSRPTAPSGARIRARLERQRPNNSHSPKRVYEDLKFTCRDCGAECLWTAAQQRLWYEEWKGAIQSTAIRCRTCRQKMRLQKMQQKQHMAELEARKLKGTGGAP